MTFEDMNLLSLEQRGTYVVGRLRKTLRAREDAVVLGTDFLLAAQNLADIGKPQSYFDVVELLKIL